MSSGPVGLSGDEGIGIGPAGGGPDEAIARWHNNDELQGSVVTLDDVGNSRGWASIQILPAGFIQIGDDPGGAIPAAATGAIRLWAGADILKDDGAGNDVAIWTSGTSGGVLGSNVLGLRPFFLGMDVSNNVGLSINSFAEVFFDPSGLYLGWQTPFTQIGNDVLNYWFGSAGPYLFGPENDPTAAVIGKLFETHGQDTLGAGATQGGARLDRGADVASPAGTPGDYDNRPGVNTSNNVGAEYGIADGAGNRNIQVDDLGSHILRAAFIEETIVNIAAYGVAVDDLCLLVKTGAVTATISLPRASNFPGRLLWVVDDDGNAPAAIVTIQRTAPDNINGANQYLMRVAYEAVLLKASNSGNNWRIIGRYP